MKRTIIAFLIFLILMLMCFSGAKTAIQLTQDAVSSIEEMKEAVYNENFSKALDLSRSFKTSWESKHRILCLYMEHKCVEKIDEIITAVIPLIEYKESGHILSEYDRMIAMIHDLQENESLSIENIL